MYIRIVDYLLFYTYTPNKTDYVALELKAIVNNTCKSVDAKSRKLIFLKVAYSLYGAIYILCSCYAPPPRRGIKQ